MRLPRAISLLVVFALLVVFSLLVAPRPALADEQPVGIITATTTTKNNRTTTTTFTLNKNGKYAVQCDTTAYIHAGIGSGTIAGATWSNDAGPTNGVYVVAYALFDVQLSAVDDTIAVTSASGTANCTVFAVSP